MINPIRDQQNLVLDFLETIYTSMKKFGTVSFRKSFWVEWDLNPGPNDSDVSSLWWAIHQIGTIFGFLKYFYTSPNVLEIYL